MQNIDPSTLFIGRKALYFPSVDSTNLVLKDMARSGDLPEGTLVIAGSQSSGRGRHGRAWFGSDGLNVYLSVLLKPTFLKVDEQAGINFCVSLALLDTLREFIPYTRLEIKWPNDILVNNSKIAGILIESNIGRNKIDQSIAGVGINVNERSFPDELDFATSMLQQSGQLFRIRDVVEVFCQKLEHRYQQLKRDHGLEQLCEAYNRELHTKGQTVTIRIDDQEHKGTVLSVEKNGTLSINLSDGIRNFNQGEIKVQAYGSGR